MATELTIPDASVPIVVEGGRVNTPWYQVLSRLARLFNDATAAIDDGSTGLNTKLSQGKHTIWVPASVMVPRTGSPELNTISMGSIPYLTMDFDPSSLESACFLVAMPKSWDEGTVSFVPVWSHASTTTNFGVEWFLRGNAISNDDTGAVTPAGQQGSIDTGGTTNDIYQGPESSAITIQDTPAENDVVWFEIFRNVNGTGDTLAVDARLHGIKLFITIDAGNDE